MASDPVFINLLWAIFVLSVLIARFLYVKKKIRTMPVWNDLPLSSEAKDWRDYLIVKRESYFKSSRLWKVVYRSLLIFTTLFGSVAAVLPHLFGFLGWVEETAIGVASISAAFSALLASMLGVLSCEEYFQLNRRHRYEVEGLLVDVAEENPDIKEISKQMMRILAERGNRE